MRLALRGGLHVRQRVVIAYHLEHGYLELIGIAWIHYPRTSLSMDLKLCNMIYMCTALAWVVLCTSVPEELESGA